MKHTILLALLASPLFISATVFNVGTAHTYLNPNSLYNAAVVETGDTILIEGEEYIGQAALAVWGKDDLVIRGVNGTPHLKADGKYIWGKGIWVAAGNNITIENIEFSEAAVPDKNGAGIRLDGVGLTVKNCFFHHNETGILAGSPYAGDIFVEFSEFGYNGNGDGQSHNIYINHVENFIFQFNYSHHAIIGHCVKSRANNTYILYNQILDDVDGRSSRLIDVPNGGNTVIMGNTMMQGPTAENKNVIGYGLEGLINTTEHNLYIINNTIVSTRPTSCLFLHIKEGTNTTSVYNNAFVGKGDLVLGEISNQSNNYFESDIGKLHFEDHASFNYHLTSTSQLIDAGINLEDINMISIKPIYEYTQTQPFKERPKDNFIDIGAFEFVKPSNTESTIVETITLYPNPNTDFLEIKGLKVDQLIKVYDVHGKQVLDFIKNGNRINTSSLSPGLYFLFVKGQRIVPFVKI